MMTIREYLILAVVVCAAVEAKVCPVDDDTDYWGNDIKGVANVKTAEACRTLCKATPGCHFFTWIKADAEGNVKNIFNLKDYRNKCHLKRIKSIPTTLVGVVSGAIDCQVTEEKWTGIILSKIWSDSQCPNIGGFIVKSLETCKQKCEAKTGCTAINFANSGGCTLRGCTLPVPEPNLALKGHAGYRVKKSVAAPVTLIAESCKADFGVILDASYSIGGEDGKGGKGADGLAWTRDKEFVQQLAKKFNISPTGAHMGLISVSDTAKLMINLNEFDDAKAFGEAVAKVPYQGGTTRLDLAFVLAQSKMFSSEQGSRPDVPKVLIVVTDGSETYRNQNKTLVNPVPYANQLKAVGVKIVAVGVPALNGEMEEEVLNNISDVVKKAPNFAGILATPFLADMKEISCPK